MRAVECVPKWRCLCIKPVSLNWGRIIAQPNPSLPAAGQEQEITSQVWTVSHHIPVGSIVAKSSKHTQIKVKKSVLFFLSTLQQERTCWTRVSVSRKVEVVFPVLLLVGPVAVSFWQGLAAPYGKFQRLLVNRVYEWTAVTGLTQKGPRAALFTAPYTNT